MAAMAIFLIGLLAGLSTMVIVSMYKWVIEFLNSGLT
jgi:hypothetical protein